LVEKLAQKHPHSGVPPHASALHLPRIGEDLRRVEKKAGLANIPKTLFVHIVEASIFQ
jgi:hypothetical protein